jgi:hypothetical protein
MKYITSRPFINKLPSLLIWTLVLGVFSIITLASVKVAQAQASDDPFFLSAKVTDCNAGTIILDWKNPDPVKTASALSYDIYRNNVSTGRSVLIKTIYPRGGTTYTVTNKSYENMEYYVVAKRKGDIYAQSDKIPVDYSNCKKLSVTCSLEEMKLYDEIIPGEYMWRASATGGTDNTYVWYSSDPVTGNSNTSTRNNPYFRKTYGVLGNVSMTVTVRSADGQKATASCSGTVTSVSLIDSPETVKRDNPGARCGSPVKISWTAVTGATAYNVYRSPGPEVGGAINDDSTWVKIASSRVTSFEDSFSNLIPGKDYYYKVISVVNGVEQKKDSLGSSRAPFTFPFYQLKTKSPNSCITNPPATTTPPITPPATTTTPATTTPPVTPPATTTPPVRPPATTTPPVTPPATTTPPIVTPPKKPVLVPLTPTECGGDSFGFKWDYQEGVSYKVYVMFEPDTEYEFIGDTAENNSTYKSGRIISNTVYDYKVVPVKDGKEYPNLASFGTTRSTPTCPIDPPTDLQAIAGESTCSDPVRLSWEPSKKAIGYNLYMASNILGPYVKIENFSTTTTDIINFKDYSAPTGDLIYAVEAYDATTVPSELAYSNKITQPDCGELDGSGDEHEEDVPDTLYPDYSLFTVKIVASENMYEGYGRGLENKLLVYAMNPIDPENWNAVTMCGNYFCETDAKYGGTLYFPKNAPGPDTEFKKHIAEVRVDGEGVKRIPVYEPINTLQETTYADGIRNQALDLPFRYSETLPSYVTDNTKITLSVDDAYRFIRLATSTVSGKIERYGIVRHEYFTPEEQKTLPKTPAGNVDWANIDWSKYEKEIKMADFEFDNASSMFVVHSTPTTSYFSSKTLGYFNNSYEDPQYSGNSGIKVKVYGCSGAVDQQKTADVSVSLFDETVNTGIDEVTTHINANFAYASVYKRHSCPNEYYQTDYSGMDNGSTNPANYKKPAPGYTITLRDSDNSIIKVVQTYYESDPSDKYNRYRMAGNIDVKFTGFDTYGGMFEESNGILGDNPDYTSDIVEENYPLASTWSEKMYARADTAIRYQLPATVSNAVRGAWTSFNQVLSSQKDNQTAGRYTSKQPKKKKPSRKAKTTKGDTPSTQKTGTAKKMDLRAEYATRDYIAKTFAIAGQEGPAINAAPCKTKVSRGCTLVAGLSESFIDALMWTRSLRKDEKNSDLIISGGTEFWLHGNRSNVREINNTTHGYSMTVDISKRNGWGSYVVNNKEFVPFKQCSRWILSPLNEVTYWGWHRWFNEDSKHFHVEGYPLLSTKNNCVTNRKNINYQNFLPQSLSPWNR